MANTPANPPLPPLYSQEAEEAVVGSILIDPDCIDLVRDKIRPTDLFMEQTREIYEVALTIVGRGGKPELISIGAELANKSNIAQIMAFIHHCIANTPTSMDAQYYAEIVRRSSFYRQIMNISNKLQTMASVQANNIAQTLDECDAMFEHLRQQIAPSSRRIVIENPRLIQSHPPRYIWNINGKEVRLSLSEITQWGKFKNRVISELNFIPEIIKDWDNTVNSMITHSVQIEVPLDASEEQQLKLIIQGWFEKRPEAETIIDVNNGGHLVREIYTEQYGQKTYYCFQSSQLIKYLKGEYGAMKSEVLWDYFHKWHSIKHSIKIKDTARILWCVPIDFATEIEIKPVQPQLPVATLAPVIVPEDF